jgi:hypothetical protein
MVIPKDVQTLSECIGEMCIPSSTSRTGSLTGPRNPMSVFRSFEARRQLEADVQIMSAVHSQSPYIDKACEYVILDRSEYSGINYLAALETHKAVKSARVRYWFVV